MNISYTITQPSTKKNPFKLKGLLDGYSFDTPTPTVTVAADKQVVKENTESLNFCITIPANLSVHVVDDIHNNLPEGAPTNSNVEFIIKGKSELIYHLFVTNKEQEVIQAKTALPENDGQEKKKVVLEKSINLKLMEPEAAAHVKCHYLGSKKQHPKN